MGGSERGHGPARVSVGRAIAGEEDGDEGDNDDLVDMVLPWRPVEWVMAPGSKLLVGSCCPSKYVTDGLGNIGKIPLLLHLGSIFGPFVMARETRRNPPFLYLVSRFGAASSFML
ncbi:hypothetical protein SUGI_0418540 [Cryptomeria japonica]|nr:hypothetical protein SUGI_0418540 [Cryptomeria japonica]